MTSERHLRRPSATAAPPSPIPNSQGEAEDVPVGRCSVFAVIQQSYPKAMLREIQPLVSPHLQQAPRDELSTWSCCPEQEQLSPRARAAPCSPRSEPSPRTCSSALAAAGARTGSRRWRLCSGPARGTPPSGTCEPPSTRPKCGSRRMSPWGTDRQELHFSCPGVQQPVHVTYN